ncbi:MAG TPA: hypothetical protein VHW72_03215 [Candidatus Angelobacter sp.]|nr:hypothetical protein [Candidatus Angelobacter sp.]
MVDFLRFIRAREAGDQHAHTGEKRADENNDDADDLPAHSDGSIPSIAYKLSHHHVIDNALQAGDRVLQHGRP